MVGDESEDCEFRGGVVGRREEKESFAPHPKRAIDVSTATRGRVLMSPPPHWFTVQAYWDGRLRALDLHQADVTVNSFGGYRLQEGLQLQVLKL